MERSIFHSPNLSPPRRLPRPNRLGLLAPASQPRLQKLLLNLCDKMPEMAHAASAAFPAVAPSPLARPRKRVSQKRNPPPHFPKPGKMAQNPVRSLVATHAHPSMTDNKRSSATAKDRRAKAAASAAVKNASAAEMSAPTKVARPNRSNASATNIQTVMNATTVRIGTTANLPPTSKTTDGLAN